MKTCLVCKKKFHHRYGKHCSYKCENVARGGTGVFETECPKCGGASHDWTLCTPCQEDAK